jgi:predicted nucleic acid-binding protein
MTPGAERFAVDTSVAIAAIDAAHTAHAPCRERVRATRPALAGHAAYEVFAVLTRLPGPLRVDARDAASILERAFPDIVWIGPDENRVLWGRLHTLGIAGGAVYDALVGEAARSHGRTLLTRDRRARRTYDLLGVEHEYID